MKKYRLVLTDGTQLDMDAATVSRDGLGVHLYDLDGNMIASFSGEDVRAVYPVSAS